MEGKHNREKRSSMTPARIELLESLGFVWDSQEIGWLEQYDALVEYINMYGHAKVAKREMTLGRWVCSQRTRLGQGKMTLDRFMKLEAVGFVWAAHSCCPYMSEQLKQMREKAKKKMEANPKMKALYSEWQSKIQPKVNR